MPPRTPHDSMPADAFAGSAYVTLGTGSAAPAPAPALWRSSHAGAEASSGREVAESARGASAAHALPREGGSEWGEFAAASTSASQAGASRPENEPAATTTRGSQPLPTDLFTAEPVHMHSTAPSPPQSPPTLDALRSRAAAAAVIAAWEEGEWSDFATAPSPADAAASSVSDSEQLPLTAPQSPQVSAAVACDPLASHASDWAAFASGPEDVNNVEVPAVRKARPEAAHLAAASAGSEHEEEWGGFSAATVAAPLPADLFCALPEAPYCHASSSGGCSIERGNDADMHAHPDTALAAAVPMQDEVDADSDGSAADVDVPEATCEVGSVPAASALEQASLAAAALPRVKHLLPHDMRSPAAAVHATRDAEPTNCSGAPVLPVSSWGDVGAAPAQLPPAGDGQEVSAAEHAATQELSSHASRPPPDAAQCTNDEPVYELLTAAAAGHSAADAEELETSVQLADHVPAAASAPLPADLFFEHAGPADASGAAPMVTGEVQHGGGSSQCSFHTTVMSWCRLHALKQRCL
jgi:hypothetical protein